MSKSKDNALLLSFTVILIGLTITSLSQPLQAVYSQTDYEEYIVMENIDQRINQKNTGSDSSTNINCGANIAGSNLSQPITCPSVPGQSPTPSRDFDTATFSRIVRLEPGSSIGTAEITCPEGTEVTGGGYELRGVNIGTRPLMDAPKDNGWKVSLNLGDAGEDTFLTVYAICGASGDIPEEICDDGVDNDGDGLIDTADPDCAGPPPPRDTDSDGISDSIDNCDNVPNPGQEDADGDGIGDACDDTPNPVELCDNDFDDDGDGLIDIVDPDCQQGEEFQFELNNCEVITGTISCEAEQTSPLPPTYDEIACGLSQVTGQPIVGSCSLTRIDGEGSDLGSCMTSSSRDTAVCFVETDG
jgi:hypothetical protein